MLRTFLLARQHRRTRRALIAGLYVVSATQIALAYPGPAVVESPLPLPVEVAPAPPPEPTKPAVYVPNLLTPRPTEWVPSFGGDCRTHGRSRACSGGRRAARGDEQARALAAQLGLGTGPAANTLLGRALPPEWLAAVKHEASETLLFPTPGATIGRGVGFTRTGRLHNVRHNGVDIGAHRDQPIRAVNDGLVAYSDNGISGYGNTVVLVHGDGSITLYAHCTETYVAPGEHVARGQVLGVVGMTGLARGPHLHFEWRRNGQILNPEPRFVGHDLPVGVRE